MGDDNTPLSAKFLFVSRGVPLADRAVIAIGPNYQLDPLHVVNIDAPMATNMRHILETGQSAIYTGLQMSRSARVDWNADDAYTRAVDGAVGRVRERVALDGAMQELLAKPEWSRDDRMAWERKLSSFVSEEVDKIPGLHEYRSQNDARYDVDVPADSFVLGYQNRLPQNIERDPMEKAYRPTYSLNELSRDIENGTIENEYDCDIMAITEGAVLQRVEDDILPTQAALSDSMKYAASYFLGTGAVLFIEMGFFPAGSGGHGYIVSSATGVVIESTDDPSHNGERNPYVLPQEGYSFEKYVSGEPYLDPDRVLYITASQTQEHMVNLVKEAMATRIGRLEEIASRYEDMPEMQAINELVRIRNWNGGALDPEHVTRWNEIVEHSAMAAEFAAMSEMSRDIESYAVLLSGFAVADLNGDAQPDLSVDRRREIRDFLKEQGDKISASMPEIPYRNAYMADNRAHTFADVAMDRINSAVEAVGRNLPPEPQLPTFYNQQNSGIKIEF